MRPKQRAALRKLFSLPPIPNPSPIRQNLTTPLEKKIMEIYRNIQTFAFKVLQKCSSLASRNGAAQMYFLTSKRNIFAGKYVKSERFLIVLREHIIFNVK